MDKKVSTPKVEFHFNKEKGGINLKWEFRVYYKNMEDGGFACYIPGFEIYFGANSEEARLRKCKTLTKLYFDHFMNDGKYGLKNLVLELHKLGFRTENDLMVVKQLIDRKPIDSYFTSNVPLPMEFEDAEKDEVTQELVIADY